jgi:hypothetical protein
MAKAQNGWPAGTPEQIGGLDNSYVPGTNVKVAPGVLKGDVAYVLFYFAEQFNKRVEKLKPGWCWGYNYRQVRGSTTDLSNHSAGCAIDLNAPAHPLGAVGTFSASQVATIKAILAECGGVLRWGGSYSGRKDEMHVEVIGSKAQVSAATSAIRKRLDPPKTTMPVSEVKTIKFSVELPIIGEGDSDSRLPGYNVIARIQRLSGLTGKDVDGVWGPATSKALSDTIKVPGTKKTSEGVYRVLFGLDS